MCRLALNPVFQYGSLTLSLSGYPAIMRPSAFFAPENKFPIFCLTEQEDPETLQIDYGPVLFWAPFLST